MAKRKTAAQRRFDDNALLFTALGLIFNQLYENYSARPIKEIADTTSGGTPLRSIKSYYGGEVPWIKSGELNDGLITHAEEFITQEGLENSSAKIFPKGTLVVALYGATVGKTGILDINAASNQAVCAITTNTKDITNNFLYWFFRYKRPEFLGASFGGAQPNISQKIIRETNIPIPPIELQKALSDFFSTVEKKQKKHEIDYLPLPDKFTNILRIVTRVEVIVDRIAKAQSLREEADREAESLVHASLNGLFGNGFINKFPNYLLGDVADIRSGVTLGRTLTGNTVRLPYLRVANVQDGYLDLSRIKEIDVLETEKDKWLLQSGDILLTEGGDWDKLGRGTVWHNEIPNCIHQNHIFRVRTNPEDFLPEYLALLIGSPYGKAYFRGASKQTTNLASINNRQLKAFTIVKPPLDEQRRIVAYLDSVQARLASLRELQSATGEELSALLPSVLDRAFKGEL